jgi:hypothetical protein
LHEASNERNAAYNCQGDDKRAFHVALNY